MSGRPVDPERVTVTDASMEVGGSGPQAGVSTAIASIVEGLDGIGVSRGAATLQDASGAEATRIGRYVIASRIGAGGMGTVYRAYDPELDRGIAIKVLHRPTDAGSHGAARVRLLREAQAMAKLSHPNVVTVYDVGTIERGGEPTVFIAMEFVPGGTLRRWAEAKDRSWADVLGMFLAAGEGLAAAHEAGLVHRDFKPENVLIGDRGPQVGDFGLARATDELEEPEHAGERAASGRSSSGPLSEPLTRTGAAVGTPAYMSPEQHCGESIDARTDQFAFAVALWEALYGERPFEGTTLAALQYNVLRGRMRTPVDSAGVPQRVHDHLLRALEVEPGARFESMRALLADLRRSQRPWWRRPWVAAAAGVVAVAGAFAFGRADDDAASLCSGAAEDLAGVWDDARREGMAAAFEATQRPFAPAALARAEHGLDDYATAWAASHRRACEATRVRGVQSEAMLDHRMACLARRLGHFRATTDLLVTADAEIVRRAVASVERLPSVSVCDDVAQLPGDADPAVSVEDRDTLRRGYDAIAQLQALRFAVRPSAWEEQLAEIDVDYAEFRVPAFRAALELEKAQMHERMRRLPEAEARAEDALMLAEEAGDDRLKLKAAMTLMTQTGLRQGRVEDGFRWERLARATLRRLGNPPLREAGLDRRVALLLYSAGRYDDALETIDRGLQVLEIEAPHKRVQRAVALNNKASILNQLARGAEALSAHHEVLAMRRDALGEHHPDVATSYSNIGNAHLTAGRAEEAIASINKALQIWSDALPEDHPDLAMGHNNLGNALGTLRRNDEAVHNYREAIRIWSKAHGEDHKLVLTAQQNLARVLYLQGRFEASRDLCVRVLEAQVQRLGPEHSELAFGHINASEASRELGDHEAALHHADRAAEVARHGLGSVSQTAVIAMRLQADARLARGRTGDAAAAADAAENAWASGKDVEGLGEEERARIALALARSLHALGRVPARVRELADSAAADASVAGVPALSAAVAAFIETL